MKEMMKGLKLVGQHKVEIAEKPKPTAGPLEAVIRTTAVCPCTTDVEIVEHLIMPSIIGNFIGHESVGVIESVGLGVTHFKPGDRVVVPALTPNWRTMEAQSGLPQFSDGSAFDWGIRKDGVFAEYINLRDVDMNAGLIPDAVTDIQALMVSDMATTSMYNVDMADIHLGDTVAVIGIGPVGLSAIAAAHLKGAGRLFAVGSRPNCIEVAREMGATDIINYRDGDYVEQILDQTGGKLLDVVIVCGGPPESLAKALKLLRYGGTVCNIQAYYEDVVIPPGVWYSGIAGKTIKGYAAIGGRFRVEKYLDLIKYGRYKPELLASPILYGVDKLEEMFWLMVNKTAHVIKPVTILP